MQTVSINYQQGGIFELPRSLIDGKKALATFQDIFTSEDNEKFEVMYRGKVAPWESMEADISLYQETEQYVKIMVTFDVTADIEVNEEDDPEEAAYAQLSFTAGGFEDDFDVTHSEMTVI